ncbi:hypothetical protein C4J88_3613 [Pseudomonas sp. R4-39-08]|uniref:hypothetical protein n=1 Tax=Pseudomonas sp. R4-39-08 TaxID=1173288 RepID=UPI000F568C4A|nr:hypothetical protein [Pseudomonas sp. R4-39-08]AZF38378.1 hypothetical protein C4J88_3613 [Pseudomonas sp. R4-39-08]
MKRFISNALALTLLCALSNGVSAETPSHRDAKIFVNQAQIGRNLPGIALSVAKRTVTYTILASRLGHADAASAVSKEIDALLPKYQSRWDEKIAQAYEKSFSDEELSSLASEGRSSKYAAKVREQQDKIGMAMESSSKPILSEMVSEALNATFSKQSFE